MEYIEYSVIRNKRSADAVKLLMLQSSKKQSPISIGNFKVPIANFRLMIKITYSYFRYHFFNIGRRN